MNSNPKNLLGILQITWMWWNLKYIENTEFEIDNEVYGTLKKPLTIEKATVDTKGYTYKVTKK